MALLYITIMWLTSLSFVCMANKKSWKSWNLEIYKKEDELQYFISYSPHNQVTIILQQHMSAYVTCWVNNNVIISIGSVQGYTHRFFPRPGISRVSGFVKLNIYGRNYREAFGSLSFVFLWYDITLTLWKMGIFSGKFSFMYMYLWNLRFENEHEFY